MNAALLVTERLVGGWPAVVADGRCVSADSLARRVRALARWLHVHGVRSGDPVQVLIPAGADFAASVLGLLWLGAVPVLIDPLEAEAVARVQLETATPRFVLTIPRLARAWRWPGLAALARLAGRPVPRRPAAPLLVLPDTDQGDIPPATVDPAHPGLVIFTSGTTARPKGVVHSHGSLSAFLEHVAALVEDLPFASCLAETPQQMFYALLRGATCHVVRGHGPGRAAAALGALRAGAVEAWFGSPWTWSRWLDEGSALPRSLRVLLLGSAPVTAPFLRRLLPLLPDDTRVRCVYGLTEAGPVCLVDGREKADGVVSGDLLGAPLPGVEVRVRGGEIEVASPAVAPQTLRGEALGPWLATGDLGRMDGARVVLLGRRKDMIVRRGHNIYPELLEPLLGGDAVLVGVSDAHAQDERVVLVHAGAADPRWTALLAEARPDHLLRVAALPRRGRQHKVDKHALRQLARQRFSITA